MSGKKKTNLLTGYASTPLESPKVINTNTSSGQEGVSMPSVYSSGMSGSASATSLSQVKKANSGPKADYTKTIFSKSKEQLAYEKQQADEIAKEVARIPKKGSVLELHQSLVNDPDKFSEFKDREEEIDKLEGKNADFIDKGVNLFAPFYWLHDALVDEKDA